MAITKAQVWQAADRLRAAGQQPTLEAVRAAVGGSYTTLSPLLRQWKERPAARRTAAVAPPAALSERVTETGEALWAAALRMATERLAGERAELERQQARWETEKTEAIALADSLSAELDAARRELEATRRELAAARAGRDRARRRVTRAREEVARLSGALESRQEALAALLARLRPEPARTVDGPLLLGSGGERRS